MLPRLTFLVLALLLGTTSSEGREEQDPLQIVTPSEWRDMTEGERHRYVLGVLEGWSFNLYAKGDLDLGPLVECVTREGVPKITLAAQNALLLGEAASPAPWWIARAMGTVCTKYRY